jgi:2-dehydro-3-deoxyphosphooctonate aldolase (KDO 8-P synthase)
MKVQIKNTIIENNSPLFFIAGPCVIEDDVMVLEIASELKRLSELHNIFMVFKASYDKANRSSISSYRGTGLKKGIRVFEKVKAETGLPVLSDIHTAEEAAKVKDVLDVLQIPAFLCRQTDLIIAAGSTGKTVNVKKGQFMSPWDMKNVVEKIESTGNRNIILTERGTMLGYNNLVVDMRSIPVMKSFGYPVVFDATHSVQLPGGEGNASGGQREFITTLSKAAVAAGCNGVFMEVHPEPSKALSDGATQIPLKEVGAFIQELAELGNFVRRPQCGV